MSLLAQGIEMLRSALGGEGSSIVYRRGSSSITLTAMKGQSEGVAEDSNGVVRMEYSDADFILAASELILGGSVVEPQRGDRIKHAADTFEVFPLAKEKCFRYSDPGKTVLRIHTKLVKKAVER